jgi:hypothetical protein
VTQNPTTATETLAKFSLATVATLSTRRNARHEHAVTDFARLYIRANFGHGTHGLVAQDATFGDFGYVTFQNMQV